MQQYTAEMISPYFMVFATNAAEKRPEFPAKVFFFWSSTSTRPKKVLKFWGRSFLFFWFAGMMAARWNLVRTERDRLVEKVADP